MILPFSKGDCYVVPILSQTHGLDSRNPRVAAFPAVRNGNHTLSPGSSRFFRRFPDDDPSHPYWGRTYIFSVSALFFAAGMEIPFEGQAMDRETGESDFHLIARLYLDRIRPLFVVKRICSDFLEKHLIVMA